MKTKLLLAAALALAACASLPDLPDLPRMPNLPDLPEVRGLDETYGERVTWSCASGSRFSIRINEETDKAEVFAHGRIFRLDQTATGYGDGELDYLERGGFASLTGAPGGPYDLCRRV